jgi:hypothetical protein
LTISHLIKPLASFDREGVVHVSILARHSAQFLFTPQDERIESGFLVVLGGWANATSSRSAIGYCFNLADKTTYAGLGQCAYLTTMVILYLKRRDDIILIFTGTQPTITKKRF